MRNRLKRLRFDKNNAPILKPFEIEERAEYMLHLFSNASLQSPRATDIPGIISRLTKDHGVVFVFDEELGETRDGHKIRGRIAPKLRRIWIEPALQTQLYRFRFTVAHEIGHLALHRWRSIKNYETIDDTDDELRQQFNHAASSRQLVEWQANRYAAAMLMPRYTVAMALLNFHEEENIQRNRGRVFLDNTTANVTLYRETLGRLSLIYHISKTVARIRLDELGLLIDKRERRLKDLADEFYARI